MWWVLLAILLHVGTTGALSGTSCSSQRFCGATHILMMSILCYGGACGWVTDDLFFVGEIDTRMMLGRIESTSDRAT